MKNEKRLIDIYFILVILFFFVFVNVLFFLTQESDMTNYLMTGVLFLLIIISYASTVVIGLLLSLVIIFAYGSLIIYLNITENLNYQVLNYFWMLAMPLAAFITGTFSRQLNQLLKKSEKYAEQNQVLVTLDELTGFSNIKKFYLDLEEEMSRARRQKIPLVLLVIQVKYYRDLMAINGRETFQKIIRNLADSVVDATRREDKKYRLEEETLAVIMPHCDPEYLDTLKGRIRNKINHVIVETEKGKRKDFQLDLQIGMIDYKEDMSSAYEFKELAEKELKFDV